VNNKGFLGAPGGLLQLVVTVCYGQWRNLIKEGQGEYMGKSINIVVFGILAGQFFLASASDLKDVASSLLATKIGQWSSALQAANIVEFKSFATSGTIQKRWDAVLQEIITFAGKQKMAKTKKRFEALKSLAPQVFEMSDRLFTYNQFQEKPTWSPAIQKSFDNLLKQEKTAKKVVGPSIFNQAKSLAAEKFGKKPVIGKLLTKKTPADTLDDFAGMIFDLLSQKIRTLNRTQGLARIEEAIGLQ
jgi:hypothetical protein